MTAAMPTEERGPLKLRFLGSLIEQLGAQLYPGATATIAELISNAWDADARHVWIELPLGRPWTEDEEIVVTDDGIGMSYDDAATRYLLVGRKRRVAPKRRPRRTCMGGCATCRTWTCGWCAMT